MILEVFVIYDSKSEIYEAPFCQRTKGEAVRTFIDLVNNPKSLVSQHPEDYTLFHVGQYDNSKGTHTNLNALLSLGTGIQYVQIKEQLSLVDKPVQDRMP